MKQFNILPVNTECEKEAKAYIDLLTKPIGSLGKLEEIAIQLAGITGTIKPDIKPGILVFAADHGVASEGVSAFPQEVTVQMALNMVQGGAGINVFARQIGAEVTVYDVGVISHIDSENIVNKKVRRSTGNFLKELAMTKEEAIQAVMVGYDAAQKIISEGVGCLIVGEVGIGNTTASSAALAVMKEADPLSIVGHGTGISKEQLTHKANVIREAITLHKPNKNDGLDILSKVGGLEMAAMAGAMIAAAENQVPILLDGFICTVSACIARLLAPGCEDYMLVSHKSVEPGHISALTFLGKEPLIQLNLRLGEGTGAAVAYPLLQSANLMIKEMATFESASVATKIE